MGQQWLCMISCQQIDDLPIKRIEYGSVVTNALSAQIVGEFVGFSQKELILGTTGVMYVSHSETSILEFDAWRNGAVFEGAIVNNYDIGPNCSIDIVVKGLKQDTSYDYCLFFESEKGERFIGDSRIMKTKVFSPSISTLDFSNIRYFDVQTAFNVIGTSEDLEQCSAGVIISDDSNVTVDDDIRMFDWDKNSSLCAVVKNLKNNSKYYMAPFLHIKTTDSYIIGEASVFQTKNVDEMAVDLGLSVKWADCFLGAQSPDEEGVKYAWGMLKSTGKSDLAYYDYYKDGEYLNIGSVISGNEKYDVATATLGGKWRMPTIEEALELTEKCKFDQEYFLITEKTKRERYVADNGNSIIFTYKNKKIAGGIITDSPIWTGSIDRDNQEKAYCFRGANSLRYMECLIRPVMDY